MTKPNRRKFLHCCYFYIVVIFDNKGVELMNIAQILHDSKVISSLPSTPIKFPIPMVTYELTSPLSAKVFNFNSFVNSLDLDEFITNPNMLPCSCENSPFSDKHHKYIVTGDLRIVANNHLRKILSKGPKFRESRDFPRAKSAILTGLEECMG